MQCAPPPPKTHTQLLHKRARQSAPVTATLSVATLSEVFAETAADGAVTGFALAHLSPDARPVLWVQDHLSRREAGLPYLAGMGVDLRVLKVDVSRPLDVLWAVEQGLGCPSLSGVIAEVWGDPPVLDFTATKRLALRAEAHAVPCWLIRRSAHPNLSAARERWRVSSLPSGQDAHDSRAPGTPHWRAELFRSRFRSPAEWVARYDRSTHRLELDHKVDARPAEAPSRQVSPRQAITS